MKNINLIINGYTNLLKKGEIQTAYKKIIDFIGKLRAEFIERYKDYEAGGIYQGYMDMSYFSLTSKPLKDKGLKIAVVYLHEKKTFEVWLSARNREIIKKYQPVIGGATNNVSFFHDNNNEDALIESVLTDEPDFEDEHLLIDTICKGTQKFIDEISNILTS